MKKILFFLLLAVCSLSVAAQIPSKKCPTCGLSIPKCQYKGKHPKAKPSQATLRPKPTKHSSTPQKGKQPEKPEIQSLTVQQTPEPAKPTTGTINGHEWVDLGLSVKWATKNIGASSPSDYGDYFAWGETTKKDEYGLSNCKTWERSISDIAGNSKYDAARANWGSTWRLPSWNEFEELVYQCTWTWTSQGGHIGYRVTSKTNGNSIFLPAACDRFLTSLGSAGEYGGYWSSTPYGGDAQEAFSLCFNASSHHMLSYCRIYGRSVRPVSAKGSEGQVP